MNKKYIVKNCPSLKTRISYKDKVWLNGCSEYGDLNDKECCNITDCLIKQVIEKCKYSTKSWDNFDIGERIKANEILKLFEIEEVE